ncbi:MAG: hypothetical protein AAF827_19460 [Cyanobacteria bacterium P01_D01_bin.6]
MSFADANVPDAPAPDTTIAQQPSQGIRGTVVRLSGNQMPTVGEAASSDPPEPVQTTIWIFAGRIPSMGSPTWPVSEAGQQANQVGTVMSDAEGNFYVELPPGEYTLFAQYGSDLYLNSFLGDGSYQPLQVREGEVTTTRLLHTENAFF